MSAAACRDSRHTDDDARWATARRLLHDDIIRTEDRLAGLLRKLDIRLADARSTALFQLATELPTAILARTRGIHITVATLQFGSANVTRCQGPQCGPRRQPSRAPNPSNRLSIRFRAGRRGKRSRSRPVFGAECDERCPQPKRKQHQFAHPDQGMSDDG
ncbi:hypothetical protein [Streptomyces sp. N2A]|uniref:hypothetical protein n=1 Tax=Streptomyces sp. N2A TaxID=3073936 RepID=UPI002870690F|nr:hypothetical protein [Streptomyces sp. N2A]